MPSDLVGPFTNAMAARAGLNPGALRSRRFRRLFWGVHIRAEADLTLAVWLAAALLVLPADSVVSHVTALRLYGLDVGPAWPIHFSTSATTHSRQRGVKVHRRRGRLTPYAIATLPVTGPDRTIVDIATKVGLVELIQAMDCLIHAGHTTLDVLTAYAAERHLDGVSRVRRAVRFARVGVESPMETLLRLMIVFARLPEPVCNLEIADGTGVFLARGDLVYPRWKVLVEYDGWHHERDSRQRQHDGRRRERLEAAGWRVIVVTSEDLKNKRQVVQRVHVALTQCGYNGTAPHFNAMWTRWFS